VIYKVLRIIFIFVFCFIAIGCNEKNDKSSDLDDDTNNQENNNDEDNEEEEEVEGDGDSILTVEYEKVMYYGEELNFKVFSKYSDDEIEVISLNDDIAFLFPNGVNQYTIVACELGTVDIKLTSKYGEELVVQVEVKAKEGFAPPIKAMEISMREVGPYYVNETYHIDYTLDTEIYNDSFKFLTSSFYEIDLDTMEIVFKRAGETTVTSITFKEGVRSSFQVEVDFNPNLQMYDILFIGNSLTYVSDIPRIISNMIESDGTYIRYSQHTVGGSYLEDHKLAFNDLIKEAKYTHVILQEQSFGPIGSYDKFREAVLYYDGLIKQNGAKTVLYQTWGYNTDSYLGYDKYTMGAALKEAYQSVADEIQSMISRVGDAFIMYEKEYVDLPTLYIDMNHQSLCGAYLSACVHYGTLTGEKASENTYIIEGIDSNLIETIQEIADKVVFGDLE